MSVPSGANEFQMSVSSPTFYEASAFGTGSFTDQEWRLQLECFLPGAGNRDAMFSFVQAVMETVRVKLATDYPGETWDESGGFSGTLSGDPWVA